MAESAQTVDDDEVTTTVNLISLSSAVKVRPRGFDGNCQQRFILDETIVEEERPDSASDFDRVEQSNTSEDAESRSATIPESSADVSSAVLYQDVPQERQNDIVSLRAACLELTAEKIELMKQLREQNDEYIRLQRQLEIEKIDNESSRQFHETSVLDAKLQELQDRCDRMQTSFDHQTAALNKLKSEANSQCEKLVLEVHALQRETRKFEQVEMARRRLQEELNNLQRAYEALQRNQGQFLSTAGKNDIDAQLTSLKQSDIALERQLATKEEELAAFRSAAIEQTKDAETELAKRDDEIARLEEELGRAKERIHSLNSLIHSYIQSVEDLELANLDRSPKENDSLQASELANQALWEQLLAEKARANRLEVLVTRLEKACDEADASEEAYEEKVTKMEERIQGLERENERFAHATDKCNREIGKKTTQISRLQTELRESQDSCSKKEQQRLKSEEKYRAVCKELQRLQSGATACKPDSSVGSGTEAPKGSSGGGLVVSGGSAIAEAGKTQLLESQVYQLQKQLYQVYKENAKLREDNRQLRLSSQSLQVREKENAASPGDASRYLRRSISECEKSGVRPLQESAHSPAGNLFTTAGARLFPRSQQPRLFPPLAFANCKK